LRHRTAPGFTLVEVLVALAVMAVIAGMAWQGIDAMVRSRDAVSARRSIPWARIDSPRHLNDRSTSPWR
jgi:prepilin-type N-terminal cleavage/methylation domain-containing protein